MGKSWESTAEGRVMDSPPKGESSRKDAIDSPVTVALKVRHLAAHDALVNDVWREIVGIEAIRCTVEMEIVGDRVTIKV
jgi:hypothetical protein